MLDTLARMGTCKRCGRFLVMDMSNRCRLCGKKANIIRAMSGTSTMTRRGAVRVFEREMKKRQKDKAKVADDRRAQRVKDTEERRAQRASDTEERRAQKASDTEERRAQRVRATTVFAAQAVAKAAALKEMTWQEAEHAACDWMQRNGYLDAAVTASGPDGGVDILSRTAIGQVKHHGRPVGLAEVQRLSGISTHEGKKAFLFAASGVTKSALAFASKAHVTCVIYPPFTPL